MLCVYARANEGWLGFNVTVRRQMSGLNMPKAVSLFSGCGGFCEGIELSGFELSCAVEVDRFAAETYRHNFPHTPLFEGDVTDFLGKKRLEHKARYKLDKIDLVFGGPPCQGYSQIGTRQLGDHRNRLYEQFARVVEELRPRIFLMENVPNLLMMNKGSFRDLIVQRLSEAGYRNATFLKVIASDYGVPQHRNRVVLVGTRDDCTFPFDMQDFAADVLLRLRIPDPVPVWDAISDLPATVVASGQTMPYPRPRKLSSFQRMMRLDFDEGLYARETKRKRGIGPDSMLLHNQHTKEMLERRRHLISFLLPGQKADSLPKEIWNGLRPEKWRRLHPGKPAYTILAQMHRDLSEWVHPKRDRWITVREAARLQSFHDGFVFVGSEWQQLKQIGNAVPPLLGHALGRMAYEALQAIDSSEASIAPRRSVQRVLKFASATR